MTVELGDVVEIDGVRMTCTCRKEYFSGWQYHFVYFSCGALKEYEFCGGELDALGARKISTMKMEKEES